MAEKVLFQWKLPRKVAKKRAIVFLHYHRFYPFNITLITAAIIIPIYLICKPILPETENDASGI